MNIVDYDIQEKESGGCFPGVSASITENNAPLFSLKVERATSKQNTSLNYLLEGQLSGSIETYLQRLFKPLGSNLICRTQQRIAVFCQLGRKKNEKKSNHFWY